MDTKTLRQVQNVELEILKALDRFCRDRGIKYSLYAGTLLGAVRHKGFIPWDDDIDIAMTRAEYTKFCKEISKNPIEGMYFENYERDSFCGTCHGKLRKNGTLLLQSGELERIGHHGIWLDIFPLDKLSNDLSVANKTKRVGKQIIFLTRANVTNKNDSIGKRFTRRIIRIITAKSRIHMLRKSAEKLRCLDSSICDNYQWTSMSTLHNLETVRFPKEIIESYTDISFENTKFMTFRNYDSLLELLFGDYMQLPPKEERICKHSPEKIIV